ncbi:D-alanyl-D-alanine carboxypeptidase family protein, partial [Sphingomonas trueperi]|uniref:D-alanyl-D-alanine carboxypeptidase family protein n=1 Tax=Sphingomonas trueperi TaxID=53317 RepID=UPI003CD09000
HNRDLLNATAALSLLVPATGSPESPGRYQTVKTLYAKGLDEVLKPASVTKVMTAMVMLDHIDNLLDTIQMAEGDQTGGSANNLQVGDIITYDDALHNMMLPSSNVTTTVVARTIGQLLVDQAGDGVPVEMFVEAMNSKARQLGMQSTYFTNPSGLNSDDMVTTVRDLGRLGIAALSYPEIIATWGKAAHTINVQGDNARSVEISHSMSIVTDDDVMGGKTGTLTGSNTTRNLLILSRMPGGNFAVSVVMLTSSENRYTDMRHLLEFVKTGYRWPASYLLSM